MIQYTVHKFIAIEQRRDFIQEKLPQLDREKHVVIKHIECCLLENTSFGSLEIFVILCHITN